eukprot:1864504-Rhodomonas_salina.1
MAAVHCAASSLDAALSVNTRFTCQTVSREHWGACLEREHSVHLRNSEPSVTVSRHCSPPMPVLTCL